MVEDKGKIVSIKGHPVEEKVPDAYTNSVGLLVSQYEFMFSFGLKSLPEDDPQRLINIRMSPQHAKVMMGILRKHVKEYEKKIGEIKILPKIVEELQIEEDLK